MQLLSVICVSRLLIRLIIYSFSYRAEQFSVLLAKLTDCLLFFYNIRASFIS